MEEHRRQASPVPGDGEAPIVEPVDEEVETVDLPEVGVIQQENLGPGMREGGGEWPDPHTPARGPSPGA